MRVGDIAANVGVGLAAGLVGTAAMTASSTAEARLRGRPPSTTPARAAGKVLGVEPTGEAERKRFSTFAHWAYGTTWGGFRGLLASAGLSGASAAAVYLATVWGTELAALPRLGVTSPPTEWGAEGLAIDLAHHVVYAGATSLAYTLLDPPPTRGARRVGREMGRSGARGRTARSRYARSGRSAHRSRRR